MATIRLRLDHPRWEPDPFPGSEDAQQQGCSCPEAQPWPGALDIDEDCPVHELQHAKPN